MSEARSAQNTYIATGDGASPESFATELAEVVSIGGPDENADEIDVTHLRSPGAYKEFIPSFKDGGELPLELNFIPTDGTQDSLTGLRYEFQQNPPPTRNRKIFWPDGSSTIFAAWVKRIGTSAAVGAKLPLMVTLRIVGPTTWSEGSPA